nr:hypothetical protein [Romeria gracilis]
MRVLRSGRDENNVPSLDWQHLCCGPEGSGAFQDNEHFFLRVMQMIRAYALSRGKNVKGGPEFLGCGAARDTGAIGLLERFSDEVLEQHFVNSADAPELVEYEEAHAAQ